MTTDKWNKALDGEAERREQLKNAAGNWDAIVDFLKDNDDPEE